MNSQSAEPLFLDALGATGVFRARQRTEIQDVAGVPVAQLSLVPDLFIARTLSNLRSANPIELDERMDVLQRAGEMFARGIVEGVTAADYELLVARVSGLPISVVRDAVSGVGQRAHLAYEDAQNARPTGCAHGWDPTVLQSGAAVWARRGNVFGVIAAGNSPGVHGSWPQALALGYRVAVRPSRNEPFTPSRLITALRASGFPSDHVAFLPTDHVAADSLIRDCDLSMVYGGDEVIRKFSGNPNVLPRGPGRSKLIITKETNWIESIDVIVDSVAGSAGTSCMNATAIFVEGDLRALATAVAERLSSLPNLHPEDERATLPVRPIEAARRLAEFVKEQSRGTEALLGADEMVGDLGDGSAVLRPAVHLLDRPDAPQTGIELPFPCVWIAPWQPHSDIEHLRNSLVVVALTRDEQLVNRLISEPTIRSVYVGSHSTLWGRPDLPHDGYLAEFLMESKAVVLN